MPHFSWILLALLNVSECSVFELTEFTKIPPEVIYIKNRTPVTLSCSARFAGEVTFKCNGKIASQNKIDTKIDIDSNNQKIITASLTVQRKQVEQYFGLDDYWCMCLARSDKNNDWKKTKKTYIREAYLDKNFQKPLPQSGGVKFGEKFVLDCRPPRGIPRPVVTWLKDGKLLEIDAVNYETTEEGDLIVNKVDHTANGNYTCRASSIVGVRETPTAVVYVWVNGGWSSWSEWSDCSAKEECGVGTRDRYRTCNNPAPVRGKACRGPKYKTDKCNAPCRKPETAFRSPSAANPDIDESESDDSKLILIASLAGAAGLALVIFIMVFVYFRSRRNFDYFKKNQMKKAPFSANHDFDLIRAPSQVDARHPHPEYSSICNRKEGLETLEQLLYRPDSNFPSSMKQTPIGSYHHSYPTKLESYPEEYGTRSSSGVSTDRNQEPDICRTQTGQMSHQLPVHTVPSTPQRPLLATPTQFHPSYPTYSYPNPYQPR